MIGGGWWWVVGVGERGGKGGLQAPVTSEFLPSLGSCGFMLHLGVCLGSCGFMLLRQGVCSPTLGSHLSCHLFCKLSLGLEDLQLT